ncbi:hypothetical protein [Granulicatella sp. WM01]|uniref:hypothetical protein n=1 Tax=Granulicatella sp. WM01 TaxID=2558277 RepID=UPI001ADDB94C|nr:hypothetical protein [Granulicatella sp. WM01]
MISVGKNNRYKHPHHDVIERLKHSKIYRTDKMGAVRYILENGKWKWKITLP